MNLIYDTKSKIIKCRHATSVDSNDRHCRYPLDSVLRLDATPQHPAELRHVDSAMPFHSHDVDADDDRRVFLSRDNIVLGVHTNVRPWRIVFAPRGTLSVLETPAGQSNMAIGTKLIIDVDKRS